MKLVPRVVVELDYDGTLDIAYYAYTNKLTINAGTVTIEGEPEAFTEFIYQLQKFFERHKLGGELNE